MIPSPSTASTAMCGRPAPPGTGAPGQRHRPRLGARLGQRAQPRVPAVRAGAPSSYPVSESSGKTTTRDAAARTAAACAIAFWVTSYGTHSG